MLFPNVENLATTDVATIPASGTVHDALRHMLHRNLRNLVVETGAPGEYGILTIADVVRTRLTHPALDLPVAQAGYRALPCFEKGSNLLDVLDGFDTHHDYAAILGENGGLYGIVSHTDILAGLDPKMVLDRQRLGNVLNRAALKTAQSDTSLDEVSAQFTDSSDAAIILDGAKGVGILTTKDMARLIGQQVAFEAPVSQYMSTPLRTVSSELTIREAVETLQTIRFKRLVVSEVNTDAPLGIVTQKDLINFTYARWTDLIRNHATALREAVNLLEHKTARLEHLVRTDTLTGIASRLAFEEAFEKERQRFHRYQDAPFSLIMADIDHFKKVNDTHGHTRGDAVLKEVAWHLQNETRRVDTVARWGGEEFAILLPHTDIAEAAQVAGKICQLLERRPIEPVGVVTASFGVTAYRPGEEIHDTIQRADQALYRAKKKGRVRVEVADHTQQHKS